MRSHLPTALRRHPLLNDEYRENVAAVIRNARGLILWCERLDIAEAWQLPQGGVEPGEEREETLWREIAEELGIQDPRAVMTLVARADRPERYEFPVPVLQNWLRRGRPSALGQEQWFYLLEFHDDPSVITLKPPPGCTPEFRRVCWDDVRKVETVVPFKRGALIGGLTQLGVITP